MKKGIVSIGEALIDFIPLDETNTAYYKSPGGAPANVAVGLARLGATSTFLGKVGKDVLGTFLKDVLEEYGVNTEYLYLTEEARTGAVFVTLAANGERSFDFYIDPSADRFLSEEEVSEELISSNKMIHFGSISMISEPARSATMKAVELAKKHQVMVSYDPNLRLGLWPNPEEAKETILSMFSQVDLIKISEEELEFLTGQTDIDAGVNVLSSYNIPILLVTVGSEGSYIFKDGEKVKVEAMKVNAVDTTGAGDAFVSGVLYQFNQYDGNPLSLPAEEIGKFAAFGSVSGGLAASTKGAMTALPTLAEVQKISKSQGLTT
ncbi:aminoimidazole riboside kinase [Bacillus alkalicellulosilyticus]|uniref:aminoimidazole riboside kinase n=1 Tax=Alkalihalobacterium alkalicellulosilyticum TaxID=1912214 RepID=UPI000996470A|nr:aminoimidazole riboside kinase [Bacillus alkalicellulosilyticus]